MGGVDLTRLTGREREVVLAAAEGLATRQIAERLFLSARTVEHHLSSSYRKLGVVGRSALIAGLSGGPEPDAPVTRYAVNGGCHIAYQVLGDGPEDLVLIPGFVSNLETAWTWPAHAAFLRRLANGRRLVMFDKRGTGLSDPVVDPAAHTLEQRVDDLWAVMDAAASRRATLFGFSEGAAVAMLASVTDPSRVDRLVLYGALISPTVSPPESPFADPEAAWALMREVWGTGRFLAQAVPGLAGDEEEMAHVARFERHGASPAAAYTIFGLAAYAELRSLCPVVTAPTLVLHRARDAFVPASHGRYLAEHLVNAVYQELEGQDHPPWVGRAEQILDALDGFLSAERAEPPRPGGVLQALLAVDPHPTPALLATVERFRGRPAGTSPGAVFAFDGAERAVACALALVGRDGGLRLAVHAGEVEVTARGITGAAVEEVNSLLGRAAPATVVMSALVRDLAAGAGLDLCSAANLVVVPAVERSSSAQA